LKASSNQIQSSALVSLRKFRVELVRRKWKKERRGRRKEMREGRNKKAPGY